MNTQGYTVNGMNMYEQLQQVGKTPVGGTAWTKNRWCSGRDFGTLCSAFRADDDGMQLVKMLSMVQR